MENKWKLQGLYWGYIRYVLGLYWDNGTKMETTIVYWGLYGINGKENGNQYWLYMELITCMGGDTIRGLPEP